MIKTRLKTVSYFSGNDNRICMGLNADPDMYPDPGFDIIIKNPIYTYLLPFFKFWYFYLQPNNHKVSFLILLHIYFLFLNFDIFIYNLITTK